VSQDSKPDPTTSDTLGDAHGARLSLTELRKLFANTSQALGIRADTLTTFPLESVHTLAVHQMEQLVTALTTIKVHFEALTEFNIYWDKLPQVQRYRRIGELLAEAQAAEERAVDALPTGSGIPC
jgi:hypothetical protein